MLYLSVGGGGGCSSLAQLLAVNVLARFCCCGFFSVCSYLSMSFTPYFRRFDALVYFLYILQSVKQAKKKNLHSVFYYSSTILLFIFFILCSTILLLFYYSYSSFCVLLLFSCLVVMYRLHGHVLHFNACAVLVSSSLPLPYDVSSSSD